MNIQSEIDFFTDLGLVDKARFVTRLCDGDRGGGQAGSR